MCFCAVSFSSLQLHIFFPILSTGVTALVTNNISAVISCPLGWLADLRSTPVQTLNQTETISWIQEYLATWASFLSYETQEESEWVPGLPSLPLFPTDFHGAPTEASLKWMPLASPSCLFDCIQHLQTAIFPGAHCEGLKKKKKDDNIARQTINLLLALILERFRMAKKHSRNSVGWCWVNLLTHAAT